MADRRYFVDIMNDIVSAVRSEYDTTNNLEPYYIYGHPVEIANRLDLKDRDSVDKFRQFPLVVLLQDFSESHGDALTVDYTLPFTIVIVTSTNPRYTSEERYTNTFKPILYPIYELLLKKMDEAEELLTVDFQVIPHTKIDRLFWGTGGLNGNERLIFNQNLDAIEIIFDGIQVSRDVFRECQ